jgi:hypothetical protein
MSLVLEGFVLNGVDIFIMLTPTFVCGVSVMNVLSVEMKLVCDVNLMGFIMFQIDCVWIKKVLSSATQRKVVHRG